MMKGGRPPDKVSCWSYGSTQSASPLFLMSFPPSLLLFIAHRPDWAGEGVVSSLVSALINNKFLYGFMKIGARKVRMVQAFPSGKTWKSWHWCMRATRYLVVSTIRCWSE